MKRLAIIADDLSSATDCGIQVARSNLSTLVLLGDYQTYGNVEELAEVISLDTDSRSVSSEEAYRRVQIATQTLLSDGFGVIYKSMDSTLRGNLGAEIDAIMDIEEFDLAIVAPAFPLYGRTTIRGQHFLHGKSIDQTEFATDPQNPVNDANLERLFASQSKRKVGLVDLDILRSSPHVVSAKLTDLEAKGVKLVVFDAQVENDLDQIVRTVASTPYRVLWVGSTGLARCIPAVLHLERKEGSLQRRASNVRRAMLVVGSTSEVTCAQLQIFRTLPNVVAVEMDPFKIITGAEIAEVEIERCCLRLKEALEGGNDIALYISNTRAEVFIAQALGIKKGLGKLEVSYRIVDVLASITQRIFDSRELGGLILTGGDTAKAVCRRLGGTGIQILEEVEPGIPLCRLIGNRHLFIITKAGGFGTPQALVRSLEVLKGVG